MNSIKFMVNNKVAANILMFSFIIFGLISMTMVKKEVFPEVTFDTIELSISYPGAAAEDIEKNIIIPIENELKSLNGITKMTSTSSENKGSIILEVEDKNIKDDVEAAVDSINNFPEEMEDIKITIPTRTKGVLTLLLYGNLSYTDLKQDANNLKYLLETTKEVSKVEISGLLKDEIQILFNPNKLKEYNLSISEISNIIKSQSLDLSGGNLETKNENIVLKVENQKQKIDEFQNLIIINSNTPVYLKDLAEIKKTFEDTDISVNYNGEQAIKIEVLTNSNTSPTDAANKVKSLLSSFESDSNIIIQNDMSETYDDRMNLLLDNALLGLFLILVLLGLFLEFKLAFWIASGIGISFIGSFIFINLFDISINMISMFAFILALGIVVDDAIIAGENIYEYKQRGYSDKEAAIKGIESIITPLSFAIITNIVAFSPLLFVSGMMGKFFFFIPAVITFIFIISWIEAVYILPKHLSYKEKPDKNSFIKFIHKIETSFSNKLNYFVETKFKKFVYKIIYFKYITVSFFISLLIVSFAYVQSGRLGFSMMPSIESDYAVVSATLKVGSTLEQAKYIESLLIKELINTNNFFSDKTIMKAYDSEITPESVIITAYLIPSKERELIPTSLFISKWRDFSSDIYFYLDSMIFKSDAGGPGGGKSDISIELSSSDTSSMKLAVQKTEELLKTLNLTDIQNDFDNGKKEFIFELNDKGKRLNLSVLEIASSIRSSIYGTTIQTHFEGDNEVDVVLKLNENSLKDFDNLSLKINSNFYYIKDILNIKESSSPSSINRENGKKIIVVSANAINKKEITAINNTIEEEFFSEIEKTNVKANFSGKESDRRENMKDLMFSFIGVLFVIYILLTIPLESYITPIIIMSTIPFSIIGAFFGHYLMGYNLSIVSMMGIVALGGVVINNTLVLIDYYNSELKKGVKRYDAIVNASVRRFRPIILTTITTFVGIMPMIFETSIQAKILIPMALSLGFGILFGTLITLLLVPALLAIKEDK